LGDGCSWNVVDDVCSVSIGEVIIVTVLYINCCTDDSTISLNFVEFRRCIFPFFVSVFMTLSKSEVQFICLNVVLCKDSRFCLLSHLFTFASIHRFRKLFFDLNLRLPCFKLKVKIKGTP
jgi:hypothetical protein